MKPVPSYFMGQFVEALGARKLYVAPTEAGVLFGLFRDGPQRVLREFDKYVEKPTASASLSGAAFRMEEKGLVLKLDGQERNAPRWALAPKGEKLVKKVVEEVERGLGCKVIGLRFGA